MAEHWNKICFKVKELLEQGFSVLDIEEKTGYDYEDVLWTINQSKKDN